MPVIEVNGPTAICDGGDHTNTHTHRLTDRRADAALPDATRSPHPHPPSRKALSQPDSLSAHIVSGQANFARFSLAHARTPNERDAIRSRESGPMVCEPAFAYSAPCAVWFDIPHCAERAMCWTARGAERTDPIECWSLESIPGLLSPERIVRCSVAMMRAPSAAQPHLGDSRNS